MLAARHADEARHPSTAAPASAVPFAFHRTGRPERRAKNGPERRAPKAPVVSAVFRQKSRRPTGARQRYGLRTGRRRRAGVPVANTVDIHWRINHFAHYVSVMLMSR